MIEWGINNGIEWNDKLRVHDFKETGRGVITNDEIKENEILISIPEKFLIHSKSKFSLEKLNPPIISNNKKGITTSKITTIENNLQSPLSIFYRPFHESVNQFNSKQRISFHLIIEKLLKKNSIWYNYLDDLPIDYSITSTYDDKEIEYLGYPIYVEKVFKLKGDMISSFNSFKEILMRNYENDLNRTIIKLNDNGDDDDENNIIKLKEIINFELYKWCWGTIQSRTYYYNRNMKQNQQQQQQQQRQQQFDDKDDCTLVPLADLFNHSSFVDTEAMFNERKQCYQVITKTKFEKDTQVFISYGKHSNFTLMNYYGFIIENNNNNDSIPLIQEDAIPIQLLEEQQQQDLKSYEKKLSILEQYGLSIYGENSKFLITMDKELPFSWNYLSVLKVLLMTKEELNNQLELNLFHYDQPISKSNYEKVLNFLKNLSITQLTQFKNYLNSYNNNNIINYNKNNNNNNNNGGGGGGGGGSDEGGINDIINNGSSIGKRFEISYILENNKKMWEGCIEWVNLQHGSLATEDIFGL
ncbi:hypothetical protein ACTA71_007936 [Dictyostelium dimigraforme]